MLTVLNFQTRPDRFGVLTPWTSQGTTLHEDRGADSRPIMDAETLDIEDLADHQTAFIDALLAR